LRDFRFWQYVFHTANHCIVSEKQHNQHEKDGTDQNSGFIFTIDDESKGLDMKGDSEFGLALGVGALCKAAIGK
jgi:hypothetical protein